MMASSSEVFRPIQDRIICQYSVGKTSPKEQGSASSAVASWSDTPRLSLGSDCGLERSQIHVSALAI